MNESHERWMPDVPFLISILRTQLASSGHQSAEVPLKDCPVPAWIELNDAGARSIRISCDPDSVSVDSRSAAVRFSKSGTGYRVSVAESVAESISEAFLTEIAQLLGSGHPVGDAGRAALQNWRGLLASHPGGILSEKELVGLIGELEILEQILRHGGDLSHWTGWELDHNDFRLPGLVIEVKSTTSANFRTVQIHGLRQLADPLDGSELILVLRRLERSPTGRSLPRMIDDLVSLGVSYPALLDKLVEVGYFEQHRSHYEDRRFVSQELVLRRVDEGHPRLTHDGLKDDVDLSAIDRIDYTLNLNADTTSDLDITLDDLLVEHLVK